MTSSNSFRVTKLGARITVRFGEALEPVGIRPKHYGLLATVAAMPGATQQQLGRVIGVVPSAIVAMVDDLVGRGALERQADPTSRRQWSIVLTAEGRALLTRADLIGQTVDEEFFGSLTPADRARLNDLLAQAD